jgi:hypothetical protein
MSFSSQSPVIIHLPPQPPSLKRPQTPVIIHLGPQQSKDELNLTFIATHNDRLRCFFAKLMSTNKDFKNKKFRNCAIIRCANVPQEFGDGVEFKMVYEGDLMEGEPTEYWSQTEFNKLELSCNGKLPICLNNHENGLKQNYVYLIRHGEGIHNLSGRTERIFDINGEFKDASLTFRGYEQAKYAALKLLKYELEGLNKKYSVHYYFGSSHLYRTRQTIAIFQQVLGINQTIYVLPCAHELPFNENGKCDDSWKNGKELTKENKPKCSYDTPNLLNKEKCNTVIQICLPTNKDEDDICKSGKYTVDWNFYERFYDTSSNESCENTDLVEQALLLTYYLNH